jgi:tetratricopeptide (TPR) repeat protein
MGGDAPASEVGAQQAVPERVPDSAAVASPSTPASTATPAPSPVWRTYSLRGLVRHPGRLFAVLLLLVLCAIPLAVLGAHLWVSHHVRAGRAALERYHNEEALAHFQAALKVRPTDPATLVPAARALRRLGAYGEAERYLEICQKEHSGDDDVILEQILLRAEQGGVLEVETYCHNRLDSGDSDGPAIYEALTRGYLRAFLWTKAKECLARWLDQSPDDVQALQLQGYVKNEQHDFQGSLDCYRRALQIDPEQDGARMHLAEELLDLTQAEEALPHLEYFTKLHPDSSRATIALARCHDQLGDSAQANQILDELLARQPFYAPALSLRGQFALRAGDLPEAEKLLRKACTLEPRNLDAHNQLYLCLVQDGKTDEAKELEPKIKEIERDLQRVQDIAHVEMARAPNDPNLMQELGAILLRAGTEEEGLRWLREALKVDPGHAAAHKTLADYYQKKGNVTEAAKYRKGAGGGQ